MTVFEAIGFFWVVMATGLTTAVVAIAATWSLTLGLKGAWRRYQLGESMERTIEDAKRGSTETARR